MGNFEKLSVLVIGVIIVMILVVAFYTWTEDPADEDDPAGVENAGTTLIGGVNPPVNTGPPVNTRPPTAGGEDPHQHPLGATADGRVDVIGGAPDVRTCNR